MDLKGSRGVPIAVLVLLTPFAPAATVSVASCSSSAIQSAVNSAASGDVVNVPGGNCTWTSTVSIPSTKGVTLDGGGATVSGQVAIASNSTKGSRVTGFNFTKANAISVSGSDTTAPFRIDHNTFTVNAGGSVLLEFNGNGPGLVDHNTLNAPTNSEMIHNMGLGATNDAGWAYTVTPGSADALYVEDNTFVNNGVSGNPAYFWGNSAIQSYYGARTVFRHNSLSMSQVDQHGTPGMIGARWWEIYENTFNIVPNGDQDKAMGIRAGSGVIFSNHKTGRVDYKGDITLYEEDSGYPALYQVGRGKNQALDPAYVWGNDSSLGVGSNSSNVQVNRDFYLSAKPGYTPFTYPYPLDASGLPSPTSRVSDAQSPTTPTSLAASAVSSSQVNLTWTASTDNVGVTGYRISRGGTQIATSTATSYSNTGLAGSTSYSYTVSAYDAAGNVSGTSNTATVTTQAAAVSDTQAPSVPTGLTTNAISTAQINLAWNAASDNVAVTGYRILRNGSQVATSVATNYSDSGLSAATSYTYAVVAFDAAGNASGNSSSSSATTLSAAPAGFIPSSRTIDWSSVGIPGGIPGANWPIYRTINPSGTSDDSVAIQSAINSAPAGSVILLGPGTFKLDRSSVVCSGLSDDYPYGVYEAGLCINKKVILRGSGADQTVLQYGDGANFISMGNTYLSSSQVVFINITAGATKGSTSLTLGSTSGITAGSYLVVTQNNPLDTDGQPLVDTSGYTGSCSDCGHSLSNNVMTQIVRVTGVSGSTITIERPLYISYTNSPKAYRLPGMVENAGLENLKLQPTASSGSGIIFKNVNMQSCARCWVKGVHSEMAVDRSHVYLSDVYGSEVRDNYLNDGYNHNSGLTYSIFLEFRASENLIENNIIRKGRHSMIMSGTSGNVFGYNYVLDPYMGEYPNSLAEDSTHGAHPYMNLWEGNVTPNIEFDFAHGSGSHNTVFRNYVHLAATRPDTGAPMTGALFAINVAYFNYYENVVGNVIGPYGSSCTASSYEINANGSQSSTIYKLGYYDDGGTASPNAALSAKVGQTILRGGNWDCKTNSVVWSSNVPSGSLVSSYLASQAIPNSLYRSGTPSWFGATPWPAIDPAGALKVSKIPAQLCYENGPKAGQPFRPSTCYGGSQSTSLLPPTGLATVIN